MRPEAWARCKVHAGLHRDSWTLRSLVGLGLCWLGQVAKTKPGGKVGCPPHVRSRRPGMAEPSHRAPQLLACLHLAKVSTLACLRRCACKGCPRDPTRPGLPALAAAGGGWPGCQAQASPSGARGVGREAPKNPAHLPLCISGRPGCSRPVATVATMPQHEVHVRPGLQGDKASRNQPPARRGTRGHRCNQPNPAPTRQPSLRLHPGHHICKH